MRVALREGSSVARAAASLFKRSNLEVVRATDGRIDMGTLAALGFAVGGAVEVAVTGNLPLPPWFQLAWWAFRTFTTLEDRAIERTDVLQGDGGGAGSAAATSTGTSGRARGV